jgi:peptidyl-prolyl cis-trans isomerase C
MIEEKVWMQKAVQNGVPNRDQVKNQLDQQRRDLIIRTYLNDVMATNPAVSDSDAQAYYDAHQDEYKVPATVTMRHILLKKEKDAKKVLQMAKAPNAKWEDLVKKWSVDTLTKASGGSLGTVTREGQFASIGPQAKLAEEGFETGEGNIGGPYQTDKGWHIIKVDAVKQESVRSFDQVKPIISRQLGSQRQQDFYKSKLDEARRSLGVKPDSAAIKTFVSQKKTAREMFNEAQALTSPQSRLDAYEALLRQYPDSEVSPQAQFMIGFIQSEELKNYDAAEAAFKQLLAKWPKAELATSASWMIEHMRSEDVPAFVDLDADSAAAGKHAPKKGSSSAKPSNGSTSGKR